MKLVLELPVKTKKIKLFLIEREDGEISLKAKDEEGRETFLMSFSSNGKFSRNCSVDKNFGFDLEGPGKIVEER
jgi:hypothetical protein